MVLSIKMHIYLQRGKLKKRFNSLSKRKFHLANLTSMRKTKFFKLQKMLINDEKWCAFYPLLFFFFFFFFFFTYRSVKFCQDII